MQYYSKYNTTNTGTIVLIANVGNYQDTNILILVLNVDFKH